MRIITGIYRRRQFKIPKSFKLHPTTDFAKENIFNVLVNFINFQNSVALDLFAGTGSISFELLSRGCKSVTCVEKKLAHCAFIKKIQLKLNVTQLQIIQADVFHFIKFYSNSFNFIFADPPYILKQLDLIPTQIFLSSLLKENGILVIEHSNKYNFFSSLHFKEHRSYGTVNFSIFHKRSNC